MLPVYFKEKTYHMPEGWNELTGEQLQTIAPILLQKEVGLTQRGYIACYLTGIGKGLFTVKESRKPDGYDYFASQILDQLVPKLDWLFTGNKLTAQLLPVITIARRFQFFGKTQLHGPAEAFNNLTIAEFSDTEACLNMYEETKDMLWLHRFLAILYRPAKHRREQSAPGFNGDSRQAYNFHLNDFLSFMLSSIPFGQKAAVLLWYYGCRAELVESNQFLFRKPDTDTRNGNFTDVIHALAGPKFGTLEETGRVLLKTAIYELKLMKEAAAE